MDGVVVDLLDGVVNTIENLMLGLDLLIIIGAIVRAGALLILFVVCALVFREIMTYRALRPHRRRRYLLRATGSNEWRKEELERWAAQLTSIRRRIRVFPDRPAMAVRIRLGTAPHGVRYTMEGHQRIRKFMDYPTLPGVEVTRLRPRTRPGAGRRGSNGRPTSGRS